MRARSLTRVTLYTYTQVEILTSSFLHPTIQDHGRGVMLLRSNINVCFYLCTLWRDLYQHPRFTDGQNPLLKLPVSRGIKPSGWLFWSLLPDSSGGYALLAF